MKQLVISQEALEKLKKDLEEHTSKRRELAERIERAKEMGDLSENFEYHEAKDAQGLNEAKIRELQHAIKTAIIADTSEKTGNVILGSKVEVKTSNKKQTFTIVSFNEADPSNGKISNESPIGEALLGHNEGDTVEVETPAGIMAFTIISID